MKRIFLIGILLLALTGCGTSDNTLDNGTNNNEDVYVTIDDERFKLNSNSNFQNMHFKENYVDFYTDAIGKTRIMSYQKNGELVFELRMMFDSIHTFDENKDMISKNASVKKLESTKKINGNEYSYYDFINDNNDTVHAYLYYYDNATYVITFIIGQGKDITDLENTFMNNVYFK